MREMVREERRAAKAHCARAARGTAAGAEETAASEACPGAAVLLILIVTLTPVLGKFFGYVLPLAAILFPLIVLQPKAPRFLNNAAFAYLCCACISAAEFYENFFRVLLTFLIGSLVYNGAALGLLRVCLRLAEKSADGGNG